ncbi:unnamed protein product [Tuber aestivum]|uniref:Uncharacterized protein n=1 Tax=Tuber aestivum TaxID=59557 RepID=A0A292PW54_9PEZI|nr:unnamed protein product [Tuber aestivum]
MLKKALASISKHRDPLMIITAGFVSHDMRIMCERQTSPYAVPGSKNCPTTKQLLREEQCTEMEIQTDGYASPCTMNVIPFLGGSTEQALYKMQRPGKEMPSEDHVLPHTTNMITSLCGSG